MIRNNIWYVVVPTPRWRKNGLGRKDPSGKQETVVRTGVGYELALEHGWFVKPYLAVDFISDEDNEPVFGLYVGKGF